MTTTARTSPTDHWQSGRNGHAPWAIVIHTTDGSAAGTLEWFADPTSRVSSHYLVTLAGEVFSLVDEGDTARHAGNVVEPTWPLLADGVNPNLYTIGIEFEDDRRPQDLERTDAQYEAGARLLAEICTRWGIPIDDRVVIGHRSIHTGKSCPGGLDLDRLRSRAREHSAEWNTVPGPRAGADRAGSHRLVWLLPVRNAPPSLEGLLDTLGGVCDAVIALDDGSDDDTLPLLTTHPNVTAVLRNPPRSSYAGWHDGANRNRLLRASAELSPDWVVFVDADEHLSVNQAHLLRLHVDRGLDPTRAYGMRLRTAWMRGHLPETPLVYRLFSPTSDDCLPTSRLHFTPVPARIDASAWEPLDVVLDHLGRRTPGDLALADTKYRQADPSGRFAACAGGGTNGPSSCEVPW